MIQTIQAIGKKISSYKPIIMTFLFALSVGANLFFFQKAYDKPVSSTYDQRQDKVIGEIKTILQQEQERHQEDIELRKRTGASFVRVLESLKEAETKLEKSKTQYEKDHRKAESLIHVSYDSLISAVEYYR